MNFEQHYGDLTNEIKLNGMTPDGNSMPINKCFLDKKFQKVVKKSNYQIDSYMNVIYEKKKDFKVG